MTRALPDHGADLPPLFDEIYSARPIRDGAIQDDGHRWVGLCAYRHHAGTSCEGGGYVDHQGLQVVVDALRGHRTRCHPGAPYPDPLGVTEDEADQ